MLHSRPLHLGSFDQPAGNDFFSNMLGGGHTKGVEVRLSEKEKLFLCLRWESEEAGFLKPEKLV